ncbi:Unknown protein, partial [Striga hermonthica]
SNCMEICSDFIVRTTNFAPVFRSYLTGKLCGNNSFSASVQCIRFVFVLHILEIVHPVHLTDFVLINDLKIVHPVHHPCSHIGLLQ